MFDFYFHTHACLKPLDVPILSLKIRPSSEHRIVLGHGQIVAAIVPFSLQHYTDSSIQGAGHGFHEWFLGKGERC